MLNLENSLDSESGSLLNCKWLILERLQSSGSRKVNDNIVTTLHFQSEGLDDALSGIVGVADRVAGVQSQRGFPAVEGFVVLV